MSPQTKQRIKLAMRRLALRWLRKLFDVLEERLHAAEVAFREEMSVRATVSTVEHRPQREGSTPSVRSSFEMWEARRSGVAVISKKEARQRRHATAASFDAALAKRVADRRFA